ncbi:tRNA (N6-threonylcarbamoyladenosine(37)-N6)-methyltransferase TrmO [Marinomonas sp. C2222]|uniref:tRNA (N6-threonylcarbamoyladenosine(37)-N6)-methyltransferase TrmO n=1 Tax=Marinomonas sargassi TaxID=2984494 RepID=A0ABT2YR34_9GAMM|nr:tRNA (N6-threonylcarbamoyladenosine(37)-N6)-methyltransferase TrmO [Marinomonas sargassi]MCV2402349.1 tRNA (N6-threonylcarbamoyladenosine(37)-N6)-methyltransferase TrmO [Marinomonas sargassi]
MPTHNPYTFSPIGIVHSCYKEKFGIPRQPGVVTAATARLELIAPYNRLDTLDGLEDISHIWIQFVFHATLSEKWKAKIRPPKLGGKKKLGVFATRSTHRPNPIGLSAVKIGKIHHENNRVFIDLYGADLLDGTPVLDIKPYLPYSDNIKEATEGQVPTPNKIVLKPVRFSEQALRKGKDFQQQTKQNALLLIEQVIGQDPRPSYLSDQTDRVHGIQLWDLNIKWCAREDHFEVIEIEDRRAEHEGQII